MSQNGNGTPEDRLRTLQDGIAKKYNIQTLRPSALLDSIKGINHSQIIASNPPPTEFVLSPCIPSQGIVYVFAGTGVGKTLFTMNMAYAIASAGDFMSYKAPKARKVLYIDGEMAYNDMYERYVSIVNQHNLSLIDDSYFVLLNQEDVRPFRLPYIDSVEGQQFYNEFIDRNESEIIVIDNLSMLSEFFVENRGETFIPIQRWILELRAKGKTVIILHHAGKDAAAYRGSSKIVDCANTTILLIDITPQRLESEVDHTRQIKIKYDKARNFSGRDAMPFMATVSRTGWIASSIEQSNMDKVINGLESKLTHTAIAQEMGVSRQYVSKLASKAITLRLIVK